MLELSKPVMNEVKALNTFAQDTKIIGNIESDGDIRLDGTLEGFLNCKGRVVIGPDAKIKGKIYARNVEVLGYVEGEITAVDLLSLKATANIKGDLIMGKFSVEPGARFTGNCKMNGNEKLITTGKDKITS